jgi:hypothetical protein
MRHSFRLTVVARAGQVTGELGVPRCGRPLSANRCRPPLGGPIPTAQCLSAHANACVLLEGTIQ